MGIDDVVYRLKLYYAIEKNNGYNSNECGHKDFDAELLRLWIKYEVKLESSMHYSQLIRLGYPDLENLAMINEDAINAILQSDGDRRRMIAGAAKLKTYYQKIEETDHESVIDIKLNH